MEGGGEGRGGIYQLLSCVVHTPCRGVVAPMMIRPFRLFSNFWGDIASNGFYARSWDYQEIVQRNRM